MKTRPLGLQCFSPAGWLHVTGDDVASFLQGQCSQDVVALPVGRVAYGLWLTQKGRVEADSLVLRVGEREYWLLCEAAAGESLRRSLLAQLDPGERDALVREVAELLRADLPDLAGRSAQGAGGGDSEVQPRRGAFSGLPFDLIPRRGQK